MTMQMNSTCDACGSLTPSNSTYCMECGSSVPEKHKPLEKSRQKQNNTSKILGVLVFLSLTLAFLGRFLIKGARYLIVFAKIILPFFYILLIVTITWATITWAIKTVFTKEKEK